MKRALTIVAILFLVLIVIPVVSAALGDAVVTAVSTVYAAAMFVLPVILVVVLVSRRKRRKASEGTAAAPAQQIPAPVRSTTTPPRQPVTITKSTSVPVVEDSHPLDCLTPDDDGDDIAYHYTNVGVFVPYTDVFDHPALVEGAIVTFRQEPENRYDHRAVAVVIGRKRIGYLFRGRLQDMANDWLERGDAVSGRIVRVAPEVVDAKNHGVAINLYFYK